MSTIAELKIAGGIAFFSVLCVAIYILYFESKKRKQ